MMECMKSMAKKPQTNADRIRSMTDEGVGRSIIWMLHRTHGRRGVFSS